MVHALGLRPNPLRRSVDRVVAVLTVVFVGAVLLALPVAATWGNISYEREVQAELAIDRHPVDAVVTGPVEQRVVGSATPHSNESLQPWAPVTWTGRDGAPRTESVKVDSTVGPGSRVGLWVDPADRITAPPRTAGQLLMSALLSTAAAWVALLTLCGALLAVIRRTADGVARRNWEREWDVVEPMWTQRKD